MNMLCTHAHTNVSEQCVLQKQMEAVMNLVCGCIYTVWLPYQPVCERLNGTAYMIFSTLQSQERLKQNSSPMEPYALQRQGKI